MKRVAKFEKVSFDQFYKDFSEENPLVSDEEIRRIYDCIQLPKRATIGSAGYDFNSTITAILEPGQSVKIPTGIRCRMDEGWVLKIYPRSGLGFKHRVQLANTVGIIDADYYNAKNEGHIAIKLTNDSKEEKSVKLSEGQGIAQGIFVEFGITEDDECEGERTGGFGSTDERK